MDKKELVRDYQDSEKKIRTIADNRDKFSEQKADEIHTLRYRIYGEKIRKLEEERDKKTDAHQKEIDEHTERADREIAELHKAIARVERISYFLKLKSKDKYINFDENNLEAGREKIEYVEKLYQDDFLKLAIVIYENGKPKNRYSLFVVGRCLFGGQGDCRDILELPRAYGCGLYTKDYGYFNVEFAVKDLPTVAELKEHLEKIRRKLLKDFMQKYQKVKDEYLGVKANYTADDFKKLIKYRCSKCGFFLTEREAMGYNLRDGKCPRCEAEGFC